MSESWRSRFHRWYFNFFPAYRRTGGRVTYLAADWMEARVELPLNRRTRNLVGTLFGGSIYAAVDPVYMTLFLKLLGDDVTVWDKAATIRFLSPGRSTLHAHFRVSPAELATVRDLLEEAGRCERSYLVKLIDGEGNVCAEVDKLLFFRMKSPAR